MKKIKLTQNKYATVDDSDYELLSAYKWHYSTTNKRYSELGYAFTIIDKKAISMHRLLTGVSEGMVVDHINRNGVDNRRKNLRVCSHRENLYNCKVQRAKTSKFKGVHLSTQRYKDKIYRYWRAGIKCESGRIHLGHFRTEKEAAEAYNAAARKYHGEYARGNNI